MDPPRASAVDGRPALRVLRLCSVFMPPARSLTGKGRAFDPIGGMQNHTAELTRALDRRGVRQTVVTTKVPRAPRLQRLGGGVEVMRLGVPIRRFRQMYSLPAARLVPRLARAAHLLHTHLGEDLAVLPIAMRAARRNHPPLVVTVHCSLRHTLFAVDARTAMLKTAGGALERRAEQRADAVIALTPTLARKLISDGVAPERVYVIPWGADPSLFRGDFPAPWPELSGPKVVFVGRFVPQKGVHVLLEAIRRMRVRDAHVILVGDGSERGSLEHSIADLDLAHRVHLTGFLPHDLIPAVLSHARLLVLPSVYEELGSILVEAMQAGLPVVASSTGGIPDAVTHEDNGLLVPPRDPEALARALDRILTESELATRLGEGAARRAVRYDWNKLAGEVLGVYRDVLGGSAPAARRSARATTPHP